jgi:hypothetical protein
MKLLALMNLIKVVCSSVEDGHIDNEEAQAIVRSILDIYYGVNG